MNINIANLRNLDLVGSSNTAGKLNIPKLVITAGIAEGQISKRALACSVSISKEAETMLEKLNDEKKQKEQDLSSKNNLSDIDPNSAIRVEGTTLSFGSNKSRMHYSAFIGREPTSSAGVLSFNNLESCYQEIREELKSQYTGEELEEHLSLLDKDYEDVSDYMVVVIKRTIINAQSIYGEKEGVRKAFESLFGMKMNELNDMYGMDDMLSKIGVGENHSFMDSIDALIKSLAQKARESREI